MQQGPSQLRPIIRTHHYSGVFSRSGAQLRPDRSDTRNRRCCARWAAVSQLRHLERAFTQTSLGPGAMVIFDVPDPAMAPAMCGVAVSSGSVQNVKLTRLFTMQEIAGIRQKARQIYGAYKPPGQR